MHKSHRVIGVFAIVFGLFVLPTATSNAIIDTPVNGWAITGSIGQDLAWRSGADVAAPGSYLINYPTGMYTAAPGTCFQILDNPISPNSCTLEKFAQDLRKNQNRSIAMSYLRACDSVLNFSCFSGFKTKSGNSAVASRFIGYLNNYVEPKEFTVLNAPDLGAPSLWRVDPSLTKHMSGTVMVLPRAIFIYLANGNTKLKNNSGNPFWGLSDFSLEIVPYYAIKFSDMPTYVPDKNSKLIPAQYDALKVVDGHICPRYAIWADSSNCYLRDSFNESVGLSADLKLPSATSARFGGRISNAEVAVSELGSWRNIQISGFPVQVPGVLLSDWLDARTLTDLNGSAYFRGSSRLKFEKLRKLVDDKSNYTIQQWKVSSAPPITISPKASASSAKRALACMTTFWAQNSSLESMVTSNAMMGQSSPPDYDGKKMTYQLGGLHFNGDGSVFLGDYEVVMNAKLARCVYGIAGAVRAEIAITDFEGGNQKVFTQSFTEKDGFLRLKISGFHFSDPTISFAFTSA